MSGDGPEQRQQSLELLQEASHKRLAALLESLPEELRDTVSQAFAEEHDAFEHELEKISSYATALEGKLGQQVGTAFGASSASGTDKLGSSQRLRIAETERAEAYDKIAKLEEELSAAKTQIHETARDARSDLQSMLDQLNMHGVHMHEKSKSRSRSPMR